MQNEFSVFYVEHPTDACCILMNHIMYIHACKMNNIYPYEEIRFCKNSDQTEIAIIHLRLSYTRRNKRESSSRRANRSCICYNEASRKSILHKLPPPFFPVSFLEQTKPSPLTSFIVIIGKSAEIKSSSK